MPFTPWEATDDTIYGVGQEVVALVDPFFEVATDQRAEIARLIAAAPDLLEALKEIASEEFSGPGGISIYAAAANELGRLKALARAALSKATGHG